MCAVLQHADEEPASGRQIPFLRDQHIDNLPKLINRAVQIDPPTGNLDVGFIGEPAIAWRVSARPGCVDHEALRMITAVRPRVSLPEIASMTASVRSGAASGWRWPVPAPRTDAPGPSPQWSTGGVGWWTSVPAGAVGEQAQQVGWHADQVATAHKAHIDHTRTPASDLAPLA
jgi:hypothetical protein